MVVKAKSNAVNKTRAAELLGVHRNTIGRYVAEGVLSEDDDGLVPLASIEALRREWGRRAAETATVATQAEDAAHYLRDWWNHNTIAAMANVVRLSRELADRYADLAARFEAGAAEPVVGERLENLDAGFAPLAEAMAHLEALRGMRHAVDQAPAEASRLAREASARTHAAHRQNRADYARLQQRGKEAL